MKRKKLYNLAINKPWLFYLIAFVFFSIILAIIDYFLGFTSSEDWKGVLTEAHGMLLDIIVFGILVSIYEKYRSIKLRENEELLLKSKKINRYKEEIDDYRFSNSEIARMRILGNIKRLNKLGSHELDLSDCNLSETVLENLNFKNSNLRASKFEDTQIKNCNFLQSKMNGAIFKNSKLGLYTPSIIELKNTSENGLKEFRENHCVKFESSILNGADFSNSFQVKTRFTNAKLAGANFSNSNLMNVHFEGAILIEEIRGEEFIANFEGSRLEDCTAFKNQRRDLERCGIDINEITFI